MEEDLEESLSVSVLTVQDEPRKGSGTALWVIQTLHPGT